MADNNVVPQEPPPPLETTPDTSSSSSISSPTMGLFQGLQVHEDNNKNNSPSSPRNKESTQTAVDDSNYSTTGHNDKATTTTADSQEDDTAAAAATTSTPKQSNKSKIMIQTSLLPPDTPELSQENQQNHPSSKDILLGTMEEEPHKNHADTEVPMTGTTDDGRMEQDQEETTADAGTTTTNTTSSSNTYSYSSMFTGWFGTNTAETKTDQSEDPIQEDPKQMDENSASKETTEQPVLSTTDHLQDEHDAVPTTTAESQPEETTTQEDGEKADDAVEKGDDTPVIVQKSDATTAGGDKEEANGTSEEEETPQRTTLDPKEQEHLEEAFQYDKKQRPKPRGLGVVHEDTPIPNSDIALRILRKFAFKTRPKIISTYGGTKSRSIVGFLFGSRKEDPTFVPYRELMDIIYHDEEERDLKEDSDRLVEDMLGETGDSMARARHAVAWYVYLCSQWGHASSRFFEAKDRKLQKEFSELLTCCLDTASTLVAHGCFDNVLIGIGGTTDDKGVTVGNEYHSAVHMIAQSIFSADLSLDQNELHAMKFLLGAGCRSTGDNGALLRGTHLLQSIRTLYHVYLTTDSTANKTTARAALQQLVTSVFARMIRTDSEVEYQQSRYTPTEDHFPSENHRDAFLVLRSICKLSMRTVPDNSGLQSHIGIQASASHETWDTKDTSNGHAKSSAADDLSKEHAQLVMTQAIHPALESKLLALELLHYVLQHSQFSKGFIQRSGSQFHSAIRNYLCVSLLKNCTSDNTRVVNLSLRIFVPLVSNFRSVLKTEIEAFVTNVFFVILDSKNSSNEHKSIVVRTFDEICSDPSTLAEIFLNYDCDLSAVDLFHRIVNTLSKVSREGLQDQKSTFSFIGGSSAARQEKTRNDTRQLRLDAMRALRQVLASLHGSIVGSVQKIDALPLEEIQQANPPQEENDDEQSIGSDGKNLVQMYDSKKKRRAEEAEVILRFNKKPSAGLKYASECGHINGSDPLDVAKYLLKNKDLFDKTQIGEYLGREPEYQGGFTAQVFEQYVGLLDFKGLVFDEAIRYFLSGFRLPGEAQKIDRIMEKFAERFTEQNSGVFPTADVAFILAFSIIMLNTDLHNPAIKEERRMTKEGFIRNNRGICDGQDLPQELLSAIFDRIKENPFSLKEDDEARARVKGENGASNPLNSTLLFSLQGDVERTRESNFQKEREHIVRTTEALLKRKRHHHETKSSQKTRKAQRQLSMFVRTEDSGLRDEYVSPMFDVTWGPALAAFSTAIESANGTVGSLITIAREEELEVAAENAAETIEVCLTGFRFAIVTAALCGNETARDAYMLGLSRFSHLGTGSLLEPRHVRCAQTMLSLAREDGELLGASWEHVFKALSEINRFHQLFHLMARNDRAAAAAADRRRARLEEREKRKRYRESLQSDEHSENPGTEDSFSDLDSLAESDLFSDDSDFLLEEEMSAKQIDEANARLIYDAVSEDIIEAIYERSSSLSTVTIRDFVEKLCLVSRNEITGGVNGGTVSGSTDDLTQVAYREQHSLLSSNSARDRFQKSQPNIYNLQKLVEVAHYNMDTRPRMIFAEIWSFVADHLTFTALHPNPALAMYAVDSFRQLSIQYLKREESEVFEFQKRFLKPLEIVMSKSHQTNTKELLLNCIDRIIDVFDPSQEKKLKSGGLKSGWLPILAICGLGARDREESIAFTSFRILKPEIEKCIDSPSVESVLLCDYFVEVVEVLFLFAHGIHYEISLSALEMIRKLTLYLADDSIDMPHLRRKSHSLEFAESSSHRELEYWWPILLGLSEVAGDSRMKISDRAMTILMKTIDSFFFPTEEENSTNGEAWVPTLQLIFKGILTPMLEYAEMGAEGARSPTVPADFNRFLSAYIPPKEQPPVSPVNIEESGWLALSFDRFVDACVAICSKAIDRFQDDTLVEEVLSILNSCLQSESATLAVRGLARVERFVTRELKKDFLTDDTWATVSHMLRNVLTVMNLPPTLKKSTKEEGEKTESEKAEETAAEEEHKAMVNEFKLQENMTTERKYLRCSTITFIGKLISSKMFFDSLGLRWSTFLIETCGKSIRDWEVAADILPRVVRPKKKELELAPDYFEMSIYARKWMNRMLLRLLHSPDIVKHVCNNSEAEEDSLTRAQDLVKVEIDRLFRTYLTYATKVEQYRYTELDESLCKLLGDCILELLEGITSLEDSLLHNLSWLDPVLLAAGTQIKDTKIRSTVQKVAQSTSPPPASPYPAPPVSPPKVESETSPVDSQATTAEEEETKVDAPEEDVPTNDKLPPSTDTVESPLEEPVAVIDPDVDDSSPTENPPEKVVVHSDPDEEESKEDIVDLS